jgi:hypothetical protein
MDRTSRTSGVGRSARARGAAAIAAALLAAGCATTGDGGRGSVEPYPAWFIAAIEPAAPAIGLAIAQVQWRKGRLYRHDEAMAAVASRLRPLDILLFSSKGRLSGHTGSGLFGHSAVYLGTESELKALGLWNDPAIVPHHAEIRDGRVIVESGQGHGVDLSPVHRVVETDRVVLIRPRDRGADWRRRSIRSGFALVGMPFDHHYRLDENRTIFCTELVDSILPDSRFPRRAAYGREIILPDDIALAAVARRGLRVVTYLRADRQDWEQASPTELRTDIEKAG